MGEPMLTITGTLDELEKKGWTVPTNTPVKTVAVARKMQPAKPGWKTTEFWVTVLVAVGSGAAAVQGSLPDRYAVWAASIGGAAYAISRAIAKH